MRNIDPEIQAAYESGELREFLLLELTLDSGTYYWTDCDIPLGLGQLYTPRDFRIDGLNYSASQVVDEMTLALANLDNLLTPDFMDGDPQGAAVAVYAVVIGYTDSRTEPGYLLLEDGSRLLLEDGSAILLDTGVEGFSIVANAKTTIFLGEIDSWERVEGDIQIDVVNKYSRRGQKTMRVHSPSCPWRFGSTECGYAAQPGESCNKSYTECLNTWNNVDQFGGQRWLPSLEGKKINWGRNG